MRQSWRSLLFVPGDNIARIEKPARSEADAVILDLEDGVAPERKVIARQGLGHASRMIAASGKAVVVRIDADHMMSDLDAAVACSPDAIMVPKADNAGTLAALSDEIAAREDRGAQGAIVGLLPLIESPSALPMLHALAAIPRSIGLAFGSEDFSLAMGVEPTPNCLDLPCRLTALAAAAYGKSCFAIPFSIAAFRNEAGFGAAVATARGFGASGGLCIHPIQVAVINRSFTPSQDAVEEARGIVAAWRSQDRGNRGAISFQGRMIDLPVVLRAERILGQFD
ncbi:CoA ester lyase [Sphingobium sp. SCG-1]|uniref:HpcH/HpaI aldolase/citrate lyase family protein n=1 Tax=Sphingobium sp. SCG-1 TaxID=2072936 RepID=UPI000CD6B2C6|nr:CoA ester lyase [Sphingobium sp. SCG-1]AUW58174.1 CoA ester lyase [Sphingobium sp. SCG-1]